jgi:gentisate 1,2-dioxygenase
MAVFDNDDRSYLTWVNNFPQSFVANVLRSPNSNYFVIHKTTCTTINSTKNSFTRKDYIKVGTHHYHELLEWAQANRIKSEPIKSCGSCKPQPNI